METQLSAHPLPMEQATNSMQEPFWFFSLQIWSQRVQLCSSKNTSKPAPISSLICRSHFTRGCSPSSGSSPDTGHGTGEGHMLQAQLRLCHLAQPPPGTGAAHPENSDIRKRNSRSPGQRQEFNFLSLHDLGQNCASVSPICFAHRLRWDRVEGV